MLISYINLHILECQKKTTGRFVLLSNRWIQQLPSKLFPYWEECDKFWNDRIKATFLLYPLMHSGSFNCHQALQNTAESTSKNHSSKSCRFTILPPEVSATACELRVVWTVSLSSPLTLAFASSDWWPAKVIYLSLSSYIPSVPPYTRTYVHFHKKHTAHIDAQ